jgi:hypothetical protein
MKKAFKADILVNIKAGKKTLLLSEFFPAD